MIRLILCQIGILVLLVSCGPKSNAPIEEVTSEEEVIVEENVEGPVRVFSELEMATATLDEANAEKTIYFGLLHGHTSFSDGSGTPDVAYDSARETGLNFFALTEHNHDQACGSDGVCLTDINYSELINVANEKTVDGEFVAIYGQEFSTISSGNHVNVFNASEVITVDNGDFRTLYENWLPEHPEVTLIQFNHPNHNDPNQNEYGIDDYDQDYSYLIEASKNYVSLIEVIIGPALSETVPMSHRDGSHQSDYLFYLNQGFLIGPSVGQDNHFDNWGFSTHARLGVWADALTRDKIIDALKARRTYASEDDNINVVFLVNGHWMGEVVNNIDNQEAILELRIIDDDEPDASYQIKLYYDDAIGGDEAKVISTKQLAGNGDIAFAHIPDSGGYYFIKITQTSTLEEPKDDIWTSPVWITSND